MKAVAPWRVYLCCRVQQVIFRTVHGRVREEWIRHELYSRDPVVMKPARNLCWSLDDQT